jgi:hypothetical protein
MSWGVERSPAVACRALTRRPCRLPSGPIISPFLKQAPRFTQHYLGRAPVVVVESLLQVIKVYLT